MNKFSISHTDFAKPLKPSPDQIVEVHMERSPGLSMNINMTMAEAADLSTQLARWVGCFADDGNGPTFADAADIMEAVLS